MGILLPCCWEYKLVHCVWRPIYCIYQNNTRVPFHIWKNLYYRSADARISKCMQGMFIVHCLEKWTHRQIQPKCPSLVAEQRRMRVCVCVTCPQASVDIVSVGIASVGTVPLAHQQWADLGRPLLPGAALQACTCRAHAGGRQPGSATCHLTAKTLTCVPPKTLWPQSCCHLSGHSQSKSCRNRRNSEIRLEREK